MFIFYYINPYNSYFLCLFMQSTERNKISAGSFDLNKWLYGGYDKDIITTIYGPAGSGKTNLCLLAAVSQAKKGRKVIFIDTEGGFSVERVRQIAGDSGSASSGDEIGKVLENIILLKPTNFEEQEQAFSSLLKEIKEKGSSISLIIVDGMTMLYRLKLAEAREQNQDSATPMDNIQGINSKLARQMRILAEIARKREIPVIITNQVYSQFLTDEDFRAGKERRNLMVGGDILKYWSKCIIELKHENGKRVALLQKHRSLREKEIDFIITNEGIKKRGWI